MRQRTKSVTIRDEARVRTMASTLQVPAERREVTSPWRRLDWRIENRTWSRTDRVDVSFPHPCRATDRRTDVVGYSRRKTCPTDTRRAWNRKVTQTAILGMTAWQVSPLHSRHRMNPSVLQNRGSTQPCAIVAELCRECLEKVVDFLADSCLP